MDNITEHNKKPENIVTEILQKWIQGTGVPRDWISLINTLEQSNQKELALEIRKKLQ